uniref:Global transcription factor group a2 n=1 Tax=Tetraselmis sp. GSL018 TaxID=582737 RepID=A0A061QXC9_9CHLO
MTPGWTGAGGATPRRDGGRTPMRDSAWDPFSGGATPVHPGAAATPADDAFSGRQDAPMTPFDNPTPGTPGEGLGPAPTPTAFTPYSAETPNTPADNPQTPAMTPGGMLAATPATPGYGAARTPYDSAATPGADLGDAVYTPYTPYTPGGIGQTPSNMAFTPSGGMAAGTPGTPGLGGSGGGGGGGGGGEMDVSHLKDVLVSVGGEGEEPALGVVTAVDVDTGACTVEVGTIGEDGQFESAPGAQEVTCHSGKLTLVRPEKKNAVKIMRGATCGQTGLLVGVDVADGIVRLDSNDDIKIIELNFLGRLVQRA